MNLVTGLIENRTFVDRLDESMGIVKEGLEPNFFISRDGCLRCSLVYRGGAKKSYPLAIFCNYLFPGYSEGQLDATLETGDEKALEKIDEAISKVVAFAHMHPDNVLQPSSEDLMATDHFYKLWTGAQLVPPTMIIGRSTSPVDLLFIDQKDYAPGIITDINWLTERSVISITLPRYLREGGAHPDLVSEVREVVRNMPLDHFLKNIRQYSEGLPCQEHVKRFREDFERDLTVFPDYPESVVDALNSIGCYDVRLVRYYPKTRKFEQLII